MWRFLFAFLSSTLTIPSIFPYCSVFFFFQQPPATSKTNKTENASVFAYAECGKLNFTITIRQHQPITTQHNTNPKAKFLLSECQIRIYVYWVCLARYVAWQSEHRRKQTKSNTSNKLALLFAQFKQFPFIPTYCDFEIIVGTTLTIFAYPFTQFRFGGSFSS